jgi:hypothetical protein
MDQVEEVLKRMKITGWRVKAEDRQELSRIVEQTKTHLGLYSQQKKRRRRTFSPLASHTSVLLITLGILCPLLFANIN